MSEVATMSISVVIENGRVVSMGASSNTDSWEFWRPFLDRLWLEEQMEKNRTVKEQQEAE